jgi:hypothetical protein
MAQAKLCRQPCRLPVSRSPWARACTPAGRRKRRTPRSVARGTQMLVAFCRRRWRCPRAGLLMGSHAWPVASSPLSPQVLGPGSLMAPIGQATGQGCPRGASKQQRRHRRRRPAMIGARPGPAGEASGRAGWLCVCWALGASALAGLDDRRPGISRDLAGGGVSGAVRARAPARHQPCQASPSAAPGAAAWPAPRRLRGTDGLGRRGGCGPPPVRLPQSENHSPAPAGRTKPNTRYRMGGVGPPKHARHSSASQQVAHTIHAYTTQPRGARGRSAAAAAAFRRAAS